MEGVGVGVDMVVVGEDCCVFEGEGVIDLMVWFDVTFATRLASCISGN